MKPNGLREFWNKVEKTTKCWLWLGAKNSEGYGSFSYRGQTVHAHRFSWVILKGQIPVGITIDHLCRVRHCVNPAHMETVNIKTNVLRGIGITAMNARKTHCKRGHEFTVANTIRVRRGRCCLACEKTRDRNPRRTHLRAH